MSASSSTAGRAGVKLLIGATRYTARGRGGSAGGRVAHRRCRRLAMRSSRRCSAFWKRSALSRLTRIFQLADKLEGSSEKLNMAQFNRLAARLSEIQIPRPPLSANEKNAMGFGYWTEKHLEFERRLNLRLAVEKAAGDPAKLKDITRPARAAVCATRWWPSTTRTTRRPGLRCCTPIRHSCAATILWAAKASHAPGMPPRSSALAGRRTAAAGWWVRCLPCPMRWRRRSRISWCRRRPRR